MCKYKLLRDKVFVKFAALSTYYASIWETWDVQDFQLAQEIPMIVNSVIEFKVIFPDCSSKISALATH